MAMPRRRPVARGIAFFEPSFMSLIKTIVARLSPPGKSAIACLGVAGPRAWDIVRSKFVRPNDRPLPDAPTPSDLYFGSLDDDVVLFVRHVEPMCVLEIDCHGG